MSPNPRVECKPIQHLGATDRVEPAAHTSEQVDHLTAGQRRPQRDVTGDVGEPLVQCDGVGPWVAAQKSHLALVCTNKSEQHPKGGGLARSVRPEEPVHFTCLDLEVEAVEGSYSAEVLTGVCDGDDGIHDSS